jgi:hypothetical protein
MKTILKSLLPFTTLVLPGAPAWVLDGMIGIHDPSIVHRRPRATMDDCHALTI